MFCVPFPAKSVTIRITTQKVFNNISNDAIIVLDFVTSKKTDTVYKYLLSQQALLENNIIHNIMKEKFSSCGQNRLFCSCSAE